MKRAIVWGGFALLVLTVVGAMRPTGDPLEGTVTTPDGTPLAGLFVTARTPGQAVSVVTDGAGRYRLGNLAKGDYEVTAHGLGVVPSAPRPYTHDGGGTLDFALAPTDDVFAQLPSASFLATLPDGETKRQFVLDCTGCHQFNRVRGTAGPLQRSHDEWAEWTSRMLAFAGANTGFPILSPSRDAAATADWLARHLGTPGGLFPGPTPPPPPPSPEAAHARITEYDLPIPSDLPHDLAFDPEGHVVITGMMTHKMYRLDPATGAFTDVPIPVEYANPRALHVDDEGWWVLLGYPQQIAHYAPDTGDWRAFDIGMYPHSIARDAAGRVWFNGHFTKAPEQIGVLDPATGTVRRFDVPTPPMPDGGSTIPYGLRLGPDGTLWATQLVGNRLIQFDPATERFRLYPLPTPFSGPRRPDVAPDGTVWIPTYAAGTLARFDPTTESFREYPLPIKDALPYIVRVDAERGGIWVATAAADAVLRFDLATETFAVYPLPTRAALIRHMALDPATGVPWVAYGNSPSVAPRIAKIELE